jgi:hypothetical protein
MKTLKEYLAESKKVYSFKVKVAGELPENFQKNLKSQLAEYGVMTLEKLATTPIQATPLDFPEMKNCEVHVFEVVCEYPVTSPELIFDIKCIGLEENCFRVRGSNEPTEQDQVLADNEPSGESLLDELDLDKGSSKIKHKDYFGNDFNRSFLKDLEKSTKQRKKEESGPTEYKLPKAKADKAGLKSAMGSK